MNKGEQNGFTIIEVILFLGVSAMLLLIAFTFTASTLRNTRFSDATKSLQSFFQEQYTRVQTNSLALNVASGARPNCFSSGAIQNNGTYTGTGTSTSCILLGAALDITDAKTITISPVLGFAQASTQALSGVNPQVWDAASETYSLAWQAELSTSSVATGTSILVQNVLNGLPTQTARVDRFLFLRNVQSEAINFYATTTTADLVTVLNSDATPSNVRNVPTLICIKSDDGGSKRGAIQIKGTGIETNTNINTVVSSVVTQTEGMFANLIPGIAGGVQCGA